MNTIEQLITAFPKATKAACGNDTIINRIAFAGRVRGYALKHGIGDYVFDSFEQLMSKIEERIEAEAPLTDQAIEAMKWSVLPNNDHDVVMGSGFSFRCNNPLAAQNLTSTQHACVDRLHAEIKRLRKAEPVAQQAKEFFAAISRPNTAEEDAAIEEGMLVERKAKAFDAIADRIVTIQPQPASWCVWHVPGAPVFTQTLLEAVEAALAAKEKPNE